MANSEIGLEQRIQNAMKGNTVIVAVFAKESCSLGRKQAEKAYRPSVKRAYHEQQMEILNSMHPTTYQTDTITLIFGVTDYMKSDEEYFNRFRKACEGDDASVFIGIRTTKLY